MEIQWIQFFILFRGKILSLAANPIDGEQKYVSSKNLILIHWVRFSNVYKYLKNMLNFWTGYTVYAL